ncbi:MAG: glycosyltransferase family 39 protein [Bacteroidales bacterium]|nr:glycosyltransferase family 39 protein [Bacteroidales bacterium]
MKKFDYSLGLLLLGAFGLFLFASFLDPFLNLWDERFHALVARNLLNHPLMPTLYENPVVSMAYDRWDRAVIWLHKQPLFLWQIALSFKLFGVNEFALRLPSVLMSTGLVYFAYRIGLQIINQRTGYIAGLLTATSFHLVELVSGRMEVDHSDVAFLFYVTGSIWAWIEYITTGKRYWILVIGLFSGFAILCKWLVGLLVYSGWGIYNILVYKLKYSYYSSLMVAFLVTILTILPWQILIFSWYPAEAQQTMQYNMLHFTRVLEGHGGSFWYYFEHFGDLFGNVALYLILPSLIVFFLRVKDKRLGSALVFMPLMVYLFFSVAATKMPSYPFIVAVPIFLLVATSVDSGLEYLNRLSLPAIASGMLILLLFVAIINLNLQPSRILELHRIDSAANSYGRIQLQNKTIFQGLAISLPERSVVFNVKGRHYVECMFYSGFPSYSFIPSEEQVNLLLAQGRHVAVFPKQGELLPHYLTSKREVTIIPAYLNGWD